MHRRQVAPAAVLRRGGRLVEAVVVAAEGEREVGHHKGPECQRNSFCILQLLVGDTYEQILFLMG